MGIIASPIHPMFPITEHWASMTAISNDWPRKRAIMVVTA